MTIYFHDINKMQKWFEMYLHKRLKCELEPYADGHEIFKRSIIHRAVEEMNWKGIMKMFLFLSCNIVVTMKFARACSVRTNDATMETLYAVCMQRAHLWRNNENTQF